MELNDFVNTITSSNCFWMLTNKSSDWATVESERYLNTQVLPIWSTKEAAIEACTEDWQEFRAVPVKMPKWYSIWLPQLMEQDMLIGIVDQQNKQCQELEPSTLTSALIKAMGAE